MKQANRIRLWRTLLTGAGLVLIGANLSGQSFLLNGTNQPGATRDFSITLAPGTTNISFGVGGVASIYSHLILRAGVAPTATNYDFIASQNGAANAINLQAPEFKLTNYVLRVFTPANSLAHEFTVTVTTNALDFRQISRPATKP